MGHEVRVGGGADRGPPRGEPGRADPVRRADRPVGSGALGDEEAGGPMSERRLPRARGQAAAAVGTAVAVAVALTLLDRAGPRVPAAADGGAALTGAWICPH